MLPKPALRVTSVEVLSADSRFDVMVRFPCDFAGQHAPKIHHQHRPHNVQQREHPDQFCHARIPERQTLPYVSCMLPGVSKLAQCRLHSPRLQCKWRKRQTWHTLAPHRLRNYSVAVLTRRNVNQHHPILFLCSSSSRETRSVPERRHQPFRRVHGE